MAHQEESPQAAIPFQKRTIALEACGLVKTYAGFQALAGVDLKICDGEIHGLIGPNGAGKTTLFNLLTKFVAPTSGRILLNGADITRLRPDAVARRGLVRSFQISSIFQHLTVRDNVRLALQRQRGASFDFWRSSKALKRLDALAMASLEAVDLAEQAATTAGSLPYGRKRALELATTLALQPKIMLLDEPMAGLAQEDIGRITALIRKSAKGRTVLMVEHNLSVVSTLCTTITVLARGRIVTEGSYADVCANHDVQVAYLGGEDA